MHGDWVGAVIANFKPGPECTHTYILKGKC